MKHVGASKYNIAWFKIADCIARGEKERALGVYRLLSHSLDDKALASQLYGDILMSFQDKAAEKKYQEAATLYHENNRFLEAAAVYEHLVILDPDNIPYKKGRIDVYLQLVILSKVQEYAHELVAYLLQKKDWNAALEIVIAYESYGDDEYTAGLHAALVEGLAPLSDVPLETKLNHAHKAIEAWRQSGNERAIAEFLKKIERIDKDLFSKVEKD